MPPRSTTLPVVLQDTDQSAEAERLYRQALEIFRASLGDDHPHTKQVARSYMQLSRAQFPDNPVLAELNTVFGENVNNN